ncbi:hypothetical protein [Microvirga soli]|uniref:hypothetical protein n=1 Tax=Microvirga soli TaxID=1854496 RepID=UPI00191EEB38|nr:hypothetical protein [Microvirga soli]
MNPHTSIVDAANKLAVQKLIRLHLPPPFDPFAEGGVTIRADLTSNRSGVPHSAETWCYEFTGTGWQMVVRATFYEGNLLEPLATHCVIERYDGTTIDAACQAANAWLKSLPI